MDLARDQARELMMVMVKHICRRSMILIPEDSTTVIGVALSCQTIFHWYFEESHESTSFETGPELAPSDSRSIWTSTMTAARRAALAETRDKDCGTIFTKDGKNQRLRSV